MQSWLGIESSEAICNACGMAEATQGCPRIAPGSQPALWPRLRHGQYQARALADRRVAVGAGRAGAQARSASSKRCKHPVRADAPSQRAIDHHNATKEPYDL